MSTPEPLWQIMEAAYDSSFENSGDEWEGRHGYAAEIRAIADWLVPEEEIPGMSPVFPGVHVGPEASDFRGWSRLGALKQRQELRSKLLAEAYRAETGQ